MKRFLAILMLVSGLRSLVSGPLLASPSTLQQAHQKEEAGDYAGAQKLYEEFLKNNSDNEEALLGLAEVEYWRGKYQSSLVSYLQVLNKNPNHVEALMGVSKDYLAMGNEKKAAEYLKKAKGAAPENEEVKELTPQLEKKTKMKVDGGFLIENPNYAQSTQGEFQTIQLDKERAYGFGYKGIYLNKFGQNGFDSQLFGHYYLLENTRVDIGITFSPKVNILPKQSYTVGLAQTIWKITPEIHYTFQDYVEANLHNIRPAIYFEPLSFLRIGGGYEYQRLTFAGTSQKFYGGFGNVKITPLEWFGLEGFYKRTDNGFEAGRTPSPYVNYKANVFGGSIDLNFLENYTLHFLGSAERRDNNENAVTYLFLLGYGF